MTRNHAYFKHPAGVRGAHLRGCCNRLAPTLERKSALGRQHVVPRNGSKFRRFERHCDSLQREMKRSLENAEARQLRRCSMTTRAEQSQYDCWMLLLLQGVVMFIGGLYFLLRCCTSKVQAFLAVSSYQGGYGDDGLLEEMALCGGDGEQLLPLLEVEAWSAPQQMTRAKVDAQAWEESNLSEDELTDQAAQLKAAWTVRGQSC
ncbi:hypothetical protein Mmc1_1922 [Magnetococcus marinus MC-1]|uniref:Transmembrane protein n=1 Tax=Magnetococcus marinus (strain ATCC BAA-1437 / JCM 17883 / MC-1) TaxID=156889 RepID=A0L8Y7_MAGMM|nr:hypothetical protein [Magnetococcus marinus]ABK44430.1 hypothetical protein Mmc1_1922 [Magnetococcus marinus MC-1]